MRVFIGIKLDEATLKKINSYLNLFYSSGVRGNYTKLNNVHMTLAFLGEVSEDKISLLKEIIRSIDISNLKELKLEKLSMLKDILICEIQKSNEVTYVHDILIKKLKENNFNVDDKKFSPHLTLVRKAVNYEKFINKVNNLAPRIIALIHVIMLCVLRVCFLWFYDIGRRERQLSIYLTFWTGFLTVMSLLMFLCAL